MRKINPIKHEERRKIILKAAARCFARDGFHGASITNICAEANIGSGNLYHYFESKEAIIEAMMVEVGLEYVRNQFNLMAGEADPIASLLAEIARVRSDRARGGQTFILDMLAESARNSSVARILRRHSKEICDLLADFIKRAQERDQIDSGLDADLTAAILLSFADGTRTLTLRDPKIDVDGTTELLRLMLDRFLRTRASKGGEGHQS